MGNLTRFCIEEDCFNVDYVTQEELQEVQAIAESKLDCADLEDCEAITDIESAIDRKANSSDVYTKTETDELLDEKQDTLVAGTNIQIAQDGKTISATDTTYTAGSGIAINNNEISCTIDTDIFIIVQSLPAVGEENKIYLVPKQGGGFTEWAYINGAWEEVGDTDIDLSNYYNKTETDALLADKADASSVYTKTETDTLLSDKADATSVYTKTETDNLLDDKADANTVYTKTETDTLLNAKADQATTYTKTETDALLDDKADADDVYTKTETDTLLADKADASTVYTKTETDTLLSDKADASTVYTKTETDTLLADKLECSDLSSCQTIIDMNTAISGKQDALTAGSNIQLNGSTISATDTTYSEATDTTLGLIKTNSDNGITLDQDGKLSITGQWGEKNGSVYFGRGSEPSVTGDAGNGVLVTEAKGLQIGNKMLSVITGAGVNLKKRAAAGATTYEFADNYTNRIVLSGFKNGFAALNETQAKIKTVRVLSVLRDGQEFVPDSSPADSTKNIIVTVEESANPDSEATQIRFYGTSGGFSNLVVGQGASCGTGNSNSCVVGQNVRNYANLSIVAGAQNYNAASRSAIFGTLNINPVSGNQNVFLAGQGHDTTNGSTNVAAVGQYSEIDANTAFAVGNGVGVYDGTGNRSNAMEVTKDGGIILKSPNGTKYKITVDNNGNLTTTAV